MTIDLLKIGPPSWLGAYGYRFEVEFFNNIMVVWDSEDNGKPTIMPLFRDRPYTMMNFLKNLIFQNAINYGQKTKDP